MRGRLPVSSVALLATVLFTPLLEESNAQVVVQPDRPPPPTDTRHPALPDLSMQERAAIYRAIMTAAPADRAATLSLDARITIGAPLPENAELLPLPEEIRKQMPTTNKYKYALGHEQVLLVDPAQRIVVDILRGYVLRDY